MAPSALRIALESGEEVGRDDPSRGSALARIDVQPAGSLGVVGAQRGSKLCLVGHLAGWLDRSRPRVMLSLVLDEVSFSLAVKRMRGHSRQ